MFLRECEGIKERIAIEDDFGNAMTYGGLENLSREYLEIIPARSLVFILFDSSIESATFYFCMMNNRVVPLLLDGDLDLRLLQNLMDIYRPQYLWGSAERLSQLEKWEPVRRVKEHVILRTGRDAPEMDGRLALLLTTSGSTGSPKLIRLSEQNVRSGAAATVAVYLAGRSEPDDKLFANLPMNHSLCLSQAHGYWAAGGSVHVTGHSILESQFWKSMEACKATAVLGVPFTLQIMQRTGFLKKNYPSLRRVLLAGGKAPVEQIVLFANELAKKNVCFMHSYGQTEVLGHFCGSEVFYAGKPESIGVPAPGYKAEISDMGELIIKGPCVCLGYAEKREDLAKGDDNRGILHTGDIVSMDEDGFLYLHGRRNRFVKMAGTRVGLDEVETLLKQEFQNQNFACVGDDDDLRVFLEGVLDPQEIARFFQQRLGIPRRAVSIRSIPKLPRNSSGKVLYRELGTYDR